MLSYQCLGFSMVMVKKVYYLSFYVKIIFIKRSYCIDKKNIYFYRLQGYNLTALSEQDKRISHNRIISISLNFIRTEIRCLSVGNCVASLCCHCSQGGSRRNLQAVKICFDKSTTLKLLVKQNNRDQSNF